MIVRHETLLKLAPVPRLIQAVRESGLFDGGAVHVARAPGRLDVMGGIADYSGSRVCEMPLAVAAAAAVQQRRDGRVVCVSLQNDKPVSLQMESLITEDPARVRGLLNDGEKWARYPVGCLWWLLRELRKQESAVADGGVTIMLDSDVPVGGGVSSSAAIEVATMLAGAHWLGMKLEPMAIATACQYVENHVVGAPCGVMDQVASCMGVDGALLEILCQPCVSGKTGVPESSLSLENNAHEKAKTPSPQPSPGGRGSDTRALDAGWPAQVIGPVMVPTGYRFAGLFSGASHEVSGDPYTEARVASFMGRKILSKLEETDVTGGMLAKMDAGKYEKLWREILPVSMQGGEFLERYGETGDTITKVKPGVMYRVRAATDHHVYEMRRVTRFVMLLKQAGALRGAGNQADKQKVETLLREAGGLMYESHASYSDNVGLGHPLTDRIVELVKQRGPGQGFYGAKITGGGSGGTVAMLLRDDAATHQRLLELQLEYEKESGRKTMLMEGTSPGAAELGVAVI